ncbi:MAG: pyrimidine-nucleoside phosphorylase [Desulfobacterales bacterium]|nr:MAG: pyrimidine-nucleoside phosphorylase [Desulfobacterales bacterium]
MNAYELIKKKRDGSELSEAEINYLVGGFVNGQIPDYQMAAFLMAVYFNGMSVRECCDLTMAMVESGDVIDLSQINGFKVDKHSTGGVGDTTTLVLAPLVAASGGIVAKMTGRELGHTGGTVDKLASIPGMNLELTKEEFIRIVNTVHVSLIAPTSRLAPADKHIYALRNVTATVDSIPLIASSIMSKKLAAGADGIVLDVKTGAGAFMPKYEDAVELAKTMVNIGECAGKKVVALITGMEQPLGNAIGNAIEVQEAIDTLGGKGPRDLVDLVLELGSMMLVISGIASSGSTARKKLETHIAEKKGLKKLAELIKAQGGNPEVIENSDLLPQPKLKIEIISEASGYVEKINALEVGMASRILGAGRKTKSEPIDPSIGILLKQKVGERVHKGEPLAVFYSDGDRQKIAAATSKFLSAYTIGDQPVEPPKLFYARVIGDNIEEFS